MDALKDERRRRLRLTRRGSSLHSERRHYIIIDAPGHIEFLKNMVTGASRAEAALLVIDAQEGIQENSAGTAICFRCWVFARSWW